ncbi:hypothetical protein EDF78_1149 [Rahnella sp. BIGb0236]|nr:hypothetical protein EDF78_1149 [Rahnella sp. BIGb0236]
MVFWLLPLRRGRLGGGFKGEQIVKANFLIFL